MTMTTRAVHQRATAALVGVLVTIALALLAAPSAATAAESSNAAVEDVGPARGLRALVTDYQSRVPTEYSQSSWTPFAGALADAQDVLEQGNAAPADLVSAKTALQDAAGELVPVAQGSFQPIT